MKKFASGIALIAGLASAQPSFEVASVKVAPEITDGAVRMRCGGGPGSASPGHMTCSHAALALLVVTAYNLPFYQVQTPEWMLWGGSKGGFDLEANVPEGTTMDQFRLMLKNLLVERFHLVVHNEMRDYPQYSLIAGKGRSKLVQSTGGAAEGNPIAIAVREDRMVLTAKHASMKNLADYLAGQVTCPVTDNTGIEGKYDFSLEFAPDPRWRGLLESPSMVEATKNGENLFSALQSQLGLKLESTKGRLNFLVVDRADKIPSEN